MIQPRFDVAESGRMRFKIRGCRGSVAVSGPEFNRFGGNTTCFEVTTDEVRLLVDAGTGISPIGRTEEFIELPTLLFLTHFHTDHIVGFPHFLPIFVHDFYLEVAAVERGGMSAQQALVEQHRHPFFPVPLVETMKVKLNERTLEEQGAMQFGDLSLRWREINHPGGCSGLRIEHGNSVVVVLSDLELDEADRAGLLDFVDGADLVLFDAQYTDEEFVLRKGWGHSTNMDAARFALEANIGEILLVHHDPARSDRDIDAMVAQAQLVFPGLRGAREGEEFELP